MGVKMKELGYEYGNIRVLTLADNVKREKIDYGDYCFNPLPVPF